MSAPDCKVGDRVSRPWGFYEILAVGDRFKVKKLMIDPEKSTSYQFHRNRVELIFDQHGKLLRMIDREQWHQLDNPMATTVLELLEVQVGDCREDDIVRQETYEKGKGRVK